MISEWIDRAVAVVSPRAAARRLAWRNALLASGAYRGARRHRGNDGWISSDGSADSDVIDDLPMLRERSRDLARNDGRAAGMVNTLVTSVIGTGIRPRPRLDEEALGISEDQARDIEKRLERVWEQFVIEADASRRLSYYGMQARAYRDIILNGEFVVLPQMVKRPREILDLCFFAIEPDRLATPGDLQGDRFVRGGVRVGQEYGEPLGYYIRRAHPGDERSWIDRKESYNYVPAFDERGRPLVLHGYHVERCGQSRGVPAFASILHEFHDLAEYREAERYAMRLAACIGLIINETGIADSGGSLETIDGRPVEGFEPGMIWRGQGLDIHQVNPQRPGTNFEAFVRDIDKTLGVSQGLTYELASKHFSEANYSSLRAAYVEARRYFQVEQQLFINSFCRPAWEWFVEEAMLRGLLGYMPEFYRRRQSWLKVQWVPMGFDWVDPAKEVSAQVKAVDAGLTTLEEEISKRTGADWRDLMRQRKAEQSAQRAAAVGNLDAESQVDERLARVVPLSKADVYQRFGRKPPEGPDDETSAPMGAPEEADDEPDV